LEAEKVGKYHYKQLKMFTLFRHGWKKGHVKGKFNVPNCKKAGGLDFQPYFQPSG
jgi:hypothetical protein